MRRRLVMDAAIVAGLLLVAVLFYLPVTLGGRTLLPADITNSWLPWSALSGDAAPVVHNSLLGDLYVQNLPWKTLIVASLRARQLPLWNPYVLSGVPFWAAGQHSALYPLSLVYYVLPLPRAYGWFAALHIWLAGTFTYLFARTLRSSGQRTSRPASLIAALAFMLGGFITSHVVFPMMVGAAVWLPLVLTAIERLVQRQLLDESGGPSLAACLADVALGVLAMGMVMLAGHPEMYYYVGLTAGAYGLWRLVAIVRRCGWGAASRTVGLLLSMALLGIGLGAAQWIPLLEFVQVNWRQGGASLADVQGWAWPLRRAVALLVPDFFGNPSHHSWFNLFSGLRQPVTVNSLGAAVTSTEWGIKNYVEGSGYLGTLPLLLAAVATLRRREGAGFFALWALFALLCVFGTPLYRLVYQLPGFSQVHTPFRWIYPWSFCVAMLAALGMDALWNSTATADAPSVRPRGVTEPRSAFRRMLDAMERAGSRLADWTPAAALAAGLGLLTALAAGMLFAERAGALADAVMRRLARAPEAFSGGQMFLSYEMRNLLVLGLALVLAGGLLLLRRRFPSAGRIWTVGLVSALLAELFVVGYGFYPRSDPALVARTTPALEWLASQPMPFRIATFGDDAILPPNTAMLYGLEDVRGYDSIIPRQYVEYMQATYPQWGLAFNRIAAIPAQHPEALDSPLLDMLNVRYVLSSEAIDREGYALAYEGEILIYENLDALPRAYTVPAARVVPDPAERWEALRSMDPRQEVILETAPSEPLPAGTVADYPLAVAELVHTANEVWITVDLPAPGLLVLADSYSEGWVAYIRPTDLDEHADPEEAEQALDIYRANGNWRAMQVPAGRHVVRVKYSPNAVKFGLYLSFMSAAVAALGLLYRWWQRHAATPEQQSLAQRVTRNTVAPIVLNLTNKAIDMVFAMLMLRILGPVQSGQYYLAVVIVSWFDIWINFGLNTLSTREVARDRAEANRYLSNTMLLRGWLWLLSFPLLGLFLGLRQATQPIEGTTILALGLFLIGLLPSNLSASLTANFNAWERMEVPASVTTLTTLLKVLFGTVALFAGTGFVRLAAVSIIVNLLTLVVLYVLHRRQLFVPRYECDWAFQRSMLGVSWPLMVNSLLATLFFKVAVILLEWLLPDPRVLGWYSTAYKYIDAVGVVPAFFTMALFPLMARYASTAHDQLMRAYQLAIKLLVMFAIPLGVVISALSTPLVGLLGGSQYLPQAADVLRIMIWYMPFGFINSVTQYVLIALGQQRYLTRAFAIGLGFNLVANIVLILRIGYIASAWVAIFSELALLIPFYLGVRRHLAEIPWLALLWRPLVSALPMVLLFLLLPGRSALLALPVGGALYLLGIHVLQALNADERRIVMGALPRGRASRR
ncbi:MAG: oligosaccharide flippase family protein [Anaerolineae bacterium]|nr:oligosaccharide flippase family protein [Chloroflexota bacterium]